MSGIHIKKKQEKKASNFCFIYCFAIIHRKPSMTVRRPSTKSRHNWYLVELDFMQIFLT